MRLLAAQVFPANPLFPRPYLCYGSFYMRKKRPATISEYIAAAAPEARSHLRQLFRILKGIAPTGTGVIKWNVPVFWDGQVLFGFSACKAHVSFGPNAAAIRRFTKELAPYKTGAATVQFPYDLPRPAALIRQIAEFCLRN